jgi:N-6 DNA Methylase
MADGRSAVRLANLVIAAQAGARAGLLGRSRRLDGARLLGRVEELALDPSLPSLGDGDAPLWSSLADRASEFAAGLREPGDIDTWVRLFQSSDPARKSRGAYATAQKLAMPMAAALIAREETPSRVLDPAAGAGGLLVAVLRRLAATAADGPEIRRHVLRLHGVEIDPVARELACLMIWLTARQPRVTPGLVGRRVVVGNAITRDWWSDESFDALIMNPPWDSLRDRYTTAEAGGSDESRGETLERLLCVREGDPELPPLYTAQGRGDRNLYKAFTELAPHLLSPRGRLVALLPGAWSSDLGTAPLRRLYLSQMRLERWTSFENRRGHFPIDGRYKFGILTGERNPAGTESFRVRAFAADAEEMSRRHVSLARADLRLIGGMAESIPDLVSASERRLMTDYRRRGVSLFASDGPFGAVAYRREVDLTEHRKQGMFERLERLRARPRGDGRWSAPKWGDLVPLVEGRMISQYDFYAKSWVHGSGRTAKWSWSNGHRLGDCRPQYLIAPRRESEPRIAICDVTSATNTRTVLASWVPPAWPCGNTAPVLTFVGEREALAALAVLNSMVFDWFARRIVAGLHLNRFYLDAMAWPRVDAAEVDLLAAAGALLTSLSPRFADLGGPKLTVPAMRAGYADAHALVELTVARGYGLSLADFDEVLSPSLSDRRGLWRHFAADPHATEIARAARAGFARRERARRSTGRRRAPIG